MGLDGINVTCLHPGATRSEFIGELVARRSAAEGKSATDVERELHGGTAIGRMITAQDIASVVCFLASPRSIALQGDVVVTSGGAAGEIRY